MIASHSSAHSSRSNSPTSSSTQSSPYAASVRESKIGTSTPVEASTAASHSGDSGEIDVVDNVPRMVMKPKAALKAGLFSNRALSDSADPASTSAESETSEEVAVPGTLAATEPVLEVRTKKFILGVSATIGLSAPFVMLLSPADLSSRAAWFGVAAISGFVLGGIYCVGAQVYDLQQQIAEQQVNA